MPTTVYVSIFLWRLLANKETWTWNLALFILEYIKQHQTHKIGQELHLQCRANLGIPENTWLYLSEEENNPIFFYF